MSSDRSSSLIAKFSSAAISEFPDIHTLDDTYLELLWTLQVGRDQCDLPWMTPGEVSKALREVFGIDVSWQKLSSLGVQNRGEVAVRRRSGHLAFQIMKEGADRLAQTKVSIVFIQPELALSKMREAQDLLSTLAGDLKICDPYVDSATLDLLASCTAASSISLLTANVRQASLLKREVIAFESEFGVPLAISVVSGKTLHDRYLIHRDGMLLIGTSLNSLGKKQSFLVEVGSDIRTSVAATYENLWLKAAPL